jgi:hypothetical protein
MCIENKLVDNWLNLNLSLADLSLPLHIGGQVSRIRSDSIQITMLYTIWSHILIITMPRPNFYRAITRMCPRGTKITGLGRYTLVSSPRDSIRIVDFGWISNLHIFTCNLWLGQSTSSWFHWIFHILKFSWGFWLTSLELLIDQGTS